LPIGQPGSALRLPQTTEGSGLRLPIGQPGSALRLPQMPIGSGLRFLPTPHTGLRFPSVLPAQVKTHFHQACIRIESIVQQNEFRLVQTQPHRNMHTYENHNHIHIKSNIEAHMHAHTSTSYSPRHTSTSYSPRHTSTSYSPRHTSTSYSPKLTFTLARGDRFTQQLHILDHCMPINRKLM